MLILSMERSLVTRAFRTFLMFIDWALYHIAAVLLQTVFDISFFTLPSSIFSKITEKVYLILGIFMLFKVTISFITFFINPDKISDKENGMGKVSFRIVMVLIMLVMIPNFFNYLGRIQEGVITTLPRIILGTSDTTFNVEPKGREVSWSVFQAFFRINPECGGTLFDGDNPKDKISQALDVVNEGCPGDDNMFKYEYTPILSSVAGGFLCYVLIGISVMVAIRMFKMIILEIIAPIPVISYIDPKASKDGAFKNWTTAIFSTWIELFVQLGILYLVIYIIDELIIQSGSAVLSYASNLGGSRTLLFVVFVILGLFMFAKQAPKFLFDSLGIKSKGAFAKAMGMSKTALGLGGAMLAEGRASWDNDQTHTPLSALKNIGAGLFRGAGDTVAGGSAVLTADKDYTKAGMDARSQNMANNLRGNTLMYRFRSGATEMFLGEDPSHRYERTMEVNQNAFNKLKDFKSTAEEKALERNDLFINLGDGRHNHINHKELMAHITGGQNGDAASNEWLIDHGFYREVTNTREVGNGMIDSKTGKEGTKIITETTKVADWQGAQLLEQDVRNAATDEHIKQVVNGTFDCGTTYGKYVYAQDAIKDAGITRDIGSLSGTKAAMGDASKQARNAELNPAYKSRPKK